MSHCPPTPTPSDNSDLLAMVYAKMACLEQRVAELEAASLDREDLEELKQTTARLVARTNLYCFMCSRNSYMLYTCPNCDNECCDICCRNDDLPAGYTECENCNHIWKLR